MTFEWRDGARLVPWLWVPLLVLVAMPFPAFNFPLPERALPILWLMLAGAACLFAVIARASWPYAALLTWAVARASLMEFPLRALQVILLAALVGLLYVAAREMPGRIAKYAAWGLVVGLAYEGLFGYVNLWGVYPLMKFILADQIGRPMGFLTHPNYWGSFMALGLPVAWSLGGIIPAVAILAMILAGFSGGPAISACVGVVVLVWPELGRRARYAVIAGAATLVSVVMTVHEWRLSGRREVWQAVWPELMRYPVIGQGFGSWRVWADHYNHKLSLTTGKPEIFATLQAHNEPYQLWFELGLIGLVFVALLVWQAGAAAWRTWRAHEAIPETPWWAPGRIPLGRAWVAVLVTGAVNSLGSPVLHLPAQAAFMVLALGQLQALAARPALVAVNGVRPSRRRGVKTQDKERMLHAA